MLFCFRRLHNQTERLLVNINCVLNNFRRLDWHFKCRNGYYPGTNNKVARSKVNDEEVLWQNDVFQQCYDPVTYTAGSVLAGPEWADPDINGIWYQSKPRWNMYDGQTYNRQDGSHIYLVNNSYPLNPIGRTGLNGRGLLGRWGPNHAVHAIVARWKRDPETNQLYSDEATGKHTIQFISVLREDVKSWSLPGRFLRGRERMSIGLKKCFIEECLNNMNLHDIKDRRILLGRLGRFFSNGILVYRGYVDDPRNTDNSWVSSTVQLFFDESNNITNTLSLQPGGANIFDVKWMDASEVSDEQFYANHGHFIKDAIAQLASYHPSLQDRDPHANKELSAPLYNEGMPEGQNEEAQIKQMEEIRKNTYKQSSSELDSSSSSSSSSV